MMKKIGLLITLLWIGVACHHPQKNFPIQTLTSPDLNSEGPFLFNNGKDIILCWTQWDEHDRNNNVLKWTRFLPEHSQFDTIKEVSPSKGLQMHAESMAKMGIFPDGTLIAVYRKKMPGDKSRFGGLMFYSISKDNGHTWSEERRLVNDTLSTSQSFYDIALLPDGRMGLSWLDSRSQRRGKTLYFATTDTIYQFSHQKPVAFSTCECCRTDLYVDASGKIRLAYRNLIEPDEPGFDGHGKVEIRDMYYLESIDTGRTFTEPIPVSRDNWHIYGCPHTGPSMAYNGQELGIIWFTGAQNRPGLFFTKKIPHTLAFKPRISVTAQGRHPQMTSLQSDYYAVYEEYMEINEKGYYPIILNKISPDMMMNTHILGDPQSRNNHAVISPVNENKLLIVWVNSDTRHPKISWLLINPKKIFKK